MYFNDIVYNDNVILFLLLVCVFVLYIDQGIFNNYKYCDLLVEEILENFVDFFFGEMVVGYIDIGGFVIIIYIDFKV